MMEAKNIFKAFWTQGVQILNVINEDPTLPLHGFEYGIYKVENLEFRIDIIDIDSEYMIYEQFITNHGNINKNTEVGKLLMNIIKFVGFSNICKNGRIIPFFLSGITFDKSPTTESFDLSIRSSSGTFDMYDKEYTSSYKKMDYDNAYTLYLATLENTHNKSECIFQSEFVTIMCNSYFEAGLHISHDMEIGMGAKDNTYYSNTRKSYTIRKFHIYTAQYNIESCQLIKEYLARLLEYNSNIIQHPSFVKDEHYYNSFHSVNPA